MIVVFLSVIIDCAILYGIFKIIPKSVLESMPVWLFICIGAVAYFSLLKLLVSFLGGQEDKDSSDDQPNITVLSNNKGSELSSKQVPKMDTSLEEYKRCPFCDEIIRKKAVVCKHCGRDLKE